MIDWCLTACQHNQALNNRLFDRSIKYLANFLMFVEKKRKSEYDLISAVFVVGWQIAENIKSV